MLIKDNHLAGVPIKNLAAKLTAVVAQSKSESPQRVIEVEVDSLEQLREVLKVDGIHVILLDNMDCPRMQTAVEIRDKVGKKGKVALEASGGVTLETVRPIAPDRGGTNLGRSAHALGLGAGYRNGYRSLTRPIFFSIISCGE